MDVGDWLGSLGLERYEQAFRDNEIDVDLLPNLTGDDLKDLGVALVGHRRRLLDAIARLRDTASGSQAAAAERAIEPSTVAPQPDADDGSGSSLRPEAERRQLNVMFVDLVGSTVLSAQARSRGHARGDPRVSEHGRRRDRAFRRSCRQVHGRRRAGVFRLAAGARGRGRAGGPGRAGDYPCGLLPQRRRMASRWPRGSASRPAWSWSAISSAREPRGKRRWSATRRTSRRACRAWRNPARS